METPSLMNKKFKYTPGGNVQAVWRRHGWIPPSEYRNDYFFKQNRENPKEQNQP